MKPPTVRRHHWFTLAAILLGVGLGLAFGYADHVGPADGLYFALTTASTVGYGDITPHGWLPHLLTVLMMVTILPLLGMAFASLTAFHLHRHQVKERDEGKAER